GAQHLPLVGALGPVIVAGALHRGRQRACLRSDRGAALVVLETGDPSHAQSRIDVGDDLPHGSGLATAAADVEDPHARKRVVLVVAVALTDDLVTGADREDAGTLGGRPGESAIGAQTLGGQDLRP